MIKMQSKHYEKEQRVPGKLEISQTPKAKKWAKERVQELMKENQITKQEAMDLVTEEFLAL